MWCLRFMAQMGTGVVVVTVKLSKKEIKLILSSLDSCKYDEYYQLWEWVDEKETDKLEKKLLKEVSL